MDAVFFELLEMLRFMSLVTKNLDPIHREEPEDHDSMDQDQRELEEEQGGVAIAWAFLDPVVADARVASNQDCQVKREIETGLVDTTSHCEDVRVEEVTHHQERVQVQQSRQDLMNFGTTAGVKSCEMTATEKENQP